MTRKQIQGYRNNLKGAVNACDNGATVELDLTTAKKLVEIIDALQKAREDAIREAAALCAPKKAKVTRGNRFTPSTKDPQSAAAQAARKQCHDAILALLNEGEQNE